MTGLVQVLIGASVLLSLAFVLALGPPRGGVAWMLASWGWVTVAFEVLLLLVTFRVPVPVWSVVVVLLAQDSVFAWRLALLWQARNRSPEERAKRTTHNIEE